MDKHLPAANSPTQWIGSLQKSCCPPRLLEVATAVSHVSDHATTCHHRRKVGEMRIGEIGVGEQGQTHVKYHIIRVTLLLDH